MLIFHLLVLAWLGVAEASEGVECAELSTPKEHLAVSWVSPVRRQVLGNAWLEVTTNKELSGFVQREKAGVGRTLQALGMRKRAKDPKRRYKVVVFEVDRGILCRPLESQLEGTTVEGVRVCQASLSKQGPQCGYSEDKATGDKGLPVYRVRWRDAARNGFCVIPAERYVVQTR